MIYRIGCFLGLLVLVGCHGTTYRIAGYANDYAYLFARAERACGERVSINTPACHTAARGLTDFKATLRLADDAVGRKGPLKLTEAQLAADREAALTAIEALEKGIIP